MTNFQISSNTDNHVQRQRPQRVALSFKVLFLTDMHTCVQAAMAVLESLLGSEDNQIARLTCQKFGWHSIAFHTLSIWREAAVVRFSSLNPICIANFVAERATTSI